MMQLELDILPAAAGAGLYLAYRFLAVRVHDNVSPKKQDAFSEDAMTEHKVDVNQELPEPEPEHKQELPFETVQVLAPRPGKIPKHQRYHPWLFGGFCVFVAARCFHFKKMIHHAANDEMEFESLFTTLPADSPPSYTIEAAIDISPELLGQLPSHDGAVPALQSAVLAPPTVAHDANDVALYSVKLERQRMPIFSVGDVVYYRSAYYGTLMVGTPAVPFKVVFDTGSGHLILPSTYCHTETCRAHRRYRRSASTTGQDIDYDGTLVEAGQPRDQITVSFGTGEVTGVFVEDIVCMNGDGATESNESVAVAGSLQDGCVSMRLIAATDMSEDPFKSFQFDGVLGLGLDGLSQTREFNFLEVVAESVEQWGGGSMPHTFGVFLAEGTSEESEIVFGGWSPTHHEDDLSWNSVLEPEMGHWMLPIKSMRVGEETIAFCNEGCKAVVDTGTSLFAVPTVAFPELYELMKHPTPLAGHCRGYGPQLHIELEHFTVTLEPRDYARLERATSLSTYMQFLPNSNEKRTGPPSRSDLFCKPMLMALDLPEPLGPKLFILGEPVLRKYYTVYDGLSKTVGIARARHQKGARPAEFLRSSGDTDASSSMFDAFRKRKLQR